MRHFSFYGPVAPDLHFYVPRTALVEQCVAQIMGDINKDGHYFSLPRAVSDQLVSMFMDFYLDREHHRLHGLPLVGVLAVLGVESDRGSPFNVQRSLHVPNLTREEVGGLFEQYQAESGQVVEPEVVDALFTATRGQPGLVSWVGELLTEKYNPGPEQAISLAIWKDVHASALAVEWNIDFQTVLDDKGRKRYVCRFSSPFVQERIYNALTGDLFAIRRTVLVLVPGDLLEDVFSLSGLHLPPLLDRYKDYLARLEARGINPWEGQPRRTGHHLPEAGGNSISTPGSRRPSATGVW